MKNTFIVGDTEYCKKCECPLYDHNEDPVDNCPQKHVFKHKDSDLEIVASSRNHAIDLLIDEFGNIGSAPNVVRFHGPFVSIDPMRGGRPKQMDEAEYIRVVGTRAGGIVCIAD